MDNINFKGKIVLIADDNPKNIQLLFNTLKEFGLRIIIAKNGKEVFERINNIIPDLILLDVMMPEMDGFETCKKLKNTDMTKDIPIIFMTASDAMEDKARGFNLGAVDYITKPFQQNEVLSRIKVHLTIKQLQNELLLINKNLEQKVIERTKELSQSEERYRQTLNFLPIGYYELDKQLNPSYLNKAGLQILGYDKKINSDEVLLKKINFDSIIVENEKAMENFNNILNNKRASENNSNDYTIINEEKEIIIRVYSKPIINDDEIVGIKGVFLDITKQKRLETEKIKQEQILIQSEKMISLGELSAGIAHEIHQPLTVISLGLSNILRLLNQKEINVIRISEKINKLDENVLRIKNIIDNIKLFSRQQNASIKESFNFHESIESALSLIDVQYTNHNIKIVKKMECKKPLIKGNKYQFEQVILNLLSNSKYSLEEKEKKTSDIDFKKTININTYDNENKKVIEFKDNGIGISRKDINKVFEPFYTTKPLNAGTGLGLSISYGIIKDMNGYIEIDSKENKYVIFKIVF